MATSSSLACSPTPISRLPRRRSFPPAGTPSYFLAPFSVPTLRLSPPWHGPRVSVRAASPGGDRGQSYPAPKRNKAEEQKPLLQVLELDTEEELEGFLELGLQSDLDAPPRHYEFVFLVGEPHLDQVPAILEKVKEQVAELRGRIWRLNDWGVRPLAYKIQKCKAAQYFLLNVEVGADMANALNTFFQRDERIVRHLMTKTDRAETQDYPAPILFNAALEGDEDEGREDDEEDEEDDEDEDDELEGDEEEEGEEEGGEEEEGVEEQVAVEQANAGSQRSRRDFVNQTQPRG